MTRRALTALTLAALALTACSFERRSPDYTCVTADECHDGRVCSGGFCVDPSTVGDGGPGADAPPGAIDGAPGDAFVCPAACTRCEGGTCIIDCNADSACGAAITCPPGLPCRVSCGVSACGRGVDCSAATACTISCNQASSCAGALTCGSGPCDIGCGGPASCATGIDCSASCTCDVTCNTDGNACAQPALCPGPTPCDDGAGCTSAPAACHGC